jgi:hypothetical protein
MYSECQMDSILTALVSHRFLAEVFAAVIALVGLMHVSVFLVSEAVDCYEKLRRIIAVEHTPPDKVQSQASVDN